jgi:hypothetical protein
MPLNCWWTKSKGWKSREIVSLIKEILTDFMLPVIGPGKHQINL